MPRQESGPAGLQASWARCQAIYGLDPRQPLRVPRLTHGEVRVRQRPLEEALARSLGVIARLRDIAADAGYCLLIADTDGVIIRDFCDSDPARALHDRGLTAGTIWQEAEVGTNGIGTAIAEGRALSVNGADHFNQELRGLFCSSAPLLDHRGVRVGTLDLSGRSCERRSELVLIDRLVAEAVAGFQTTLFRHHHRRDLIVALSAAAPGGEEDGGLVAIDDGGRILGATAGALPLLGASDPADLAGRPADAAIGIAPDLLERAAGRLMRREGRPGYARALPRPAPQSPPPARRIARAPSAARPDLGRPDLSRPGLDALAGGDAVMAERVGLARRLLDRGLPILLQGETGTGKDVFARAMHRESVRGDAPFIAVNCAAIPATLLDAELFGYAPGTFTGGLKEGKPGRIAAAAGGTLFLDEIGDMPLELQTRLLRVLADGEVVPLGGGAPRRVDFSLICATHRDLDRLVAAGGFRQDLYYRIAGATIALPALRQRSDIVELAQAFIAAEHPGVTLTAPALALIASHDWPGNIRQLRHALTFAALTCQDGRIAATDLPALAGTQPSPAQRAPLRQAAGAAERARILSALAAAGGRVTGAARLLGVSRATLHRRLRSLAIRR